MEAVPMMLRIALFFVQVGICSMFIFWVLFFILRDFINFFTKDYLSKDNLASVIYAGVLMFFLVATFICFAIAIFLLLFKAVIMLVPLIFDFSKFF